MDGRLDHVSKATGGRSWISHECKVFIFALSYSPACVASLTFTKTEMKADVVDGAIHDCAIHSSQDLGYRLRTSTTDPSTTSIAPASSSTGIPWTSSVVRIRIRPPELQHCIRSRKTIERANSQTPGLSTYHLCLRPVNWTQLRLSYAACQW